MRARPELRLHEELLLLALDDEKGSIRATNFKYGICAGLLAELVLEGRVTLERGAKPSRDRILPDNPKLLSDPLLDEVIRKIHGSKKPRSPKDWVGRLAQMGGLRKRVLHPSAGSWSGSERRWRERKRWTSAPRSPSRWLRPRAFSSPCSAGRS